MRNKIDAKKRLSTDLSGRNLTLNKGIFQQVFILHRDEVVLNRYFRKLSRWLLLKAVRDFDERDSMHNNNLNRY